MRKFFTSLFAFMLSGFAGGLVAQELAVATGAQEEYIIVFMFSVLATCIVTFVFFVAQFQNDPVAAVAKTGKWLLIVFVVLLTLLVALILYTDSSAAVVKKDIPLVVGLALPGLVTIVLQWLFVRWRVRRGLITAQVNA
ncbi:hypothetical protein EN829_028445 [Mesorhizobium sp. M00.F.Ca.ET.186.01.1.1]|nr:hypothetical protein EN848_27625 [bacterium M00.F.Ca.ET.205.01.1.1]TGU48195.1 hypothetical protein EN795_28905 [bacterium M00.F.Ca.ET.152.01.1.1]TGV32433.1 hypothetical protein EN829_028445 [Mesorhizobium sp. M00.F.Ca.ET.186.01.1.1]TGZ39646.1 hypothetical protein EN805_28300 [bacterium M00.F.Ca.ET.162.01.1.1]TIW62914.1 MAG: hypothetical protein E5V48_02295 [Mesorhizobium sp.]